jgi:hypothetical protein
MPAESPWPVVVGVCTTGLFAMLIVGRLGVAAFFGVLVLLALAGWHGGETR